MFVSLALTALLFEAAVGYPQMLVQRIGHPVMWMGALIAWADDRWNRAGNSFALRQAFGVALVVLLVAGMAAVGGVATWLLAAALGDIAATLILGVAASSLLAQRSLDTHVAAVAEGLETSGLEGGRRAVAMIVGRDPERLDEAGVSRAAIESLAENFSDGVVAPLFWLFMGGLPGVLIYKAVNTADSMIGHLSDRHRAFGWAAARLDDLINLPASRLSAVWIAAAARVVPGASSSSALHAVARDASNHRSPNAGWPEAAMAGALGLRLAGPRVYHGHLVTDAWMGDGRADLNASDIRRALQLYRFACVIQALFVAIIFLVKVL
ncbi:Cobalamin biosynthetic protein (anaerobic pathway of cobalamin biosynthesis, cobD) [Bradyrhizobium sp. ORS 278]|uniref:adenosylcobinamide-phosphate synthase CbiB n=1 Tax=Bradyrhizobium sp. (strain ORS 278) TaxID=114615 RepID=UPI0001508BBD|nr:adenosylcobinamide-phosphate synthase CbiB [Bradyrhizobium sp. ORS 278]CAL78626.1 Cobalamin biosynthetic protein (anaerobic pathway of cobalamin biosynthesis, cobD) [Bradyrhizobium sp. ORS 278]